MAEGPGAAPHSCLQECLNADDGSNWGLLCNGTSLRLLHDNPALVKPAYVQVALDQVFEGGLFDEFAVVWLLLHASRFQRTAENTCLLDGWKQAGQQSGERALNKLRDGVQAALEAVGQGLLQHPANGELVARLQSGELSTQVFFRQLLRLVYRLLFLCVAEDRHLLFAPEVPLDLRQIYREGYSLSRLRDLAIKSGAHEQQHGDLWRVQQLVFGELGRGGSSLGLPGLGGLFGAQQCPDLDKAQLSNAALLEAVRAIGWFYDEQSQSRTRINYQALNTEEFGSVYESLLELHPQISGSGASLRFALGGVAGSERKTSGSYYTPEELVRLLILSALLPVIRDRLNQASSQEEKAAALLAIRVLDPACGSGHFLLAAARRLALELARILAGDDEPNEELRRQCLRRVVAHCLYGVDKNPMAVELCKVALWIEAIDPGKPLSFLDAHIQCGDSLVGVFDPEVLKDGIPDGAYKPLTGDEKPVCTSLKKANQQFNKRGQRDLFSFAAGTVAVPSQAALEAVAEDNLAGVAAKAQAHREWLQQPAVQQQLLAANVVTAAFFLPKTTASQAVVPTSEHLDAALQGGSIPPAMAAAVSKAAADFRFLHWHLAFPDVMQAGGFDCLLGNPPWERIKLQEKEFFAARSEAIATAANKAARERLIQALSAADASEADRALVREFELAKREAEGSGEFIRGSERFALTAVGDLNTYALFAEHFLNLIGPDGRAGLIVPTGIATDNSTKAYFDAISGKGKLVSLISFENESFIFREVHHAFKFCVLTLREDAGLNASTQYCFYIRHFPQLSQADRFFSLTADEITLLNPNTRTCPVFRSQMDAELTRKIYHRVPVLIDEALREQGNPWGIKFMRMFDMLNDSSAFSTANELTLRGGQRSGIYWSINDKLYTPLYEAKMIGTSCHKLSTYPRGAHERGFRVLPESSSSDLSDPGFDAEPFYWVSKEDYEERVRTLPGDILFAFKDVTASTNERTFIGCFLPKGFAAGHTLPVISSAHDDLALFACAMQGANSLVFDYCARQKVSGLHMTYFLLQQLPVLLPSQIGPQDRSFLLPRIKALNVTTTSQGALAESLGFFTEHPHPWNAEERLVLFAELDAYYAHLYGLTRDELRYILDPADLMGPDYPSETFRVLKNNEIRQFGEYRTQRLVLEAWDRLFGG